MKIKKGFTLVELLIVISVIGILASMMMLSGSSTVSTADANKIITNLRTLAIASMQFYTDSIDVYKRNQNEGVKLEYVLPYTYNNQNFPEKEKYKVKNNNGTWWAGYDTGNNTSLTQKLSGQAEKAGLKGTTANNNDTPLETSAKYNGEKWVWLFIRADRF